MTIHKREKIKYYEIFLDKEKENVNLSKKHFEKQLGIYIECFNLLADTCVHIFDVLEKPLADRDASIAFQCARILGSLRVYIDLLIRGYYFDATIIERTLVEDFFLIRCFMEDEKYVDKWVKKELKFSQVKKELKLYSSESFVGYYEYLSDFVHSNVPAFQTLTEFYKRRKHAYGFNIAPNIQIYFTPSFTSDPVMAIRFFPVVGYLTINWLTKFYWNIMNPAIRTRIARILKKWESEFLKFNDELEKELEKIEKTSSKRDE